MEKGFARGSFSRRVLSLFLLCTVVPTLLLSIYAYLQASRVVDEEMNARLAESARFIGQNLIERLNIAQSVIHRATDGNNPAEQIIQTIRFVEGLPAPDAPRLLTDSFDEGSARVMLKDTVNGKTITGEINQEFIWGVSTVLPPDLSFCVLSTETEIPLFCSEDSLPLVSRARRLISGHAGVTDMESANANVRVAHWTLFLDGRFNASSWTVVVGRNRENVLHEYSFIRSFPLTIALVICAATVLSMIQIRRRTEPLQSLLRATYRIRQRDFSPVEDVTTGDEFESLARSFNTMSYELRTRFDRLQLFSELDRRILKDGFGDDVVTWLLRSSIPIFDFHAIALIIDDKSASLARYSINAGETHVDLAQLEIPLPDWLCKAVDEGSVTPPCLAENLIPSLSDCAHINVFGITQGNARLGVLLIGFDSSAQQQMGAEGMEEFRDRTALALSSRKRDAELFDKAHYDQLTGLPNRYLFTTRLAETIQRATQRKERIGVLFLDLDRFKTVNDSLGHAIGDSLLVEAAGRLRSCLGQEDTVSRMGGDEFTAIVSDHDAVIATADRILQALSDPFEIEGHWIYVTASIGVAFYPDDGDRTDVLLRNADAAMYEAKDPANPSIVAYSEELSQRAISRLKLETRVSRALRDSNFELYYQPQYRAADGRVCGAEALIRLKDGNQDGIGPDQFIPVAEQSGQIQAIGDWVLNEACRMLARLQQNGLLLDRLSINVSPTQLRNPRFSRSFLSIVGHHGISPNQLSIEITETVLAQSVETTERNLQELTNHGCQIVLDDFGTGHSSISYLQQFTIHALKLDRTFVVRSATDHRDRLLASAIIELAHSLSIPVTAEGVETDEQLQAMNALGCDLVQGYLFSRPIQEHDLIALLTSVEANS